MDGFTLEITIKIFLYILKKTIKIILYIYVIITELPVRYSGTPQKLSACILAHIRNKVLPSMILQSSND